MNQDILDTLQHFLEIPPYSLACTEKLALQFPYLEKLCAWHQQHCPEFAKIAALQLQLNSAYQRQSLSSELKEQQAQVNYSLQQTQSYNPSQLSSVGYAHYLQGLPFTPVRLFKEMLLKSIPETEIYKIMSSSGTMGSVSRIVLDRETAVLQSKVLNHIMYDFIGKNRRRMLIIDSKTVLKDPKMFSARGAGIMGMMPFGHHHVYALDENYEPQTEQIIDFLTQHKDEPLLLFGFTFMVWQHLYQILAKHNIKLELTDAVLIHAGGWKKMQQLAVDNQTFKLQLKKVLGEHLKIHNFYGMVEQTGSVYIECEAGHLHVSNFSDLLIRDPFTHTIMPFNQNGVIETISMLPLSYPGFAILTEDMGEILGEDDCPCGRKGKYFRVTGRIPLAELRGCSDVYNK